jgi:flagellar basal-body rod modification protein FlgD
VINQVNGPGQAPTVPTPPGGKLGKDEFLKMLVAQMRNQDPLNPMQGEQMAAQLAQFSSLEQLTNMSKGLETLTEVMGGEMLHAMNASSAMNVLGRTVVAVGDQVTLDGGENPAVTVDVGGGAAKATLKIFDANGREVGSRELGALSAGRRTIALEDAVKGLPEGTYRYQVEATNAAGDPVNVRTLVRARVDGVRYGSEGPILTAGGMSLPFASVIEIVAD